MEDSRINSGHLPADALPEAAASLQAGTHQALQAGARMTKKIIIIAAGITLYEALKAQEELAQENVDATVVDCYSVKPIDSETLLSLARSHLAGSEISVITVEDHWFEGGLGDAVLNVFSNDAKVKVYKLAVTKLPHSGKPAELLDYEEISAAAIIRKVKAIL